MKTNSVSIFIVSDNVIKIMSMLANSHNLASTGNPSEKKQVAEFGIVIFALEIREVYIASILKSFVQAYLIQITQLM